MNYYIPLLLYLYIMMPTLIDIFLGPQNLKNPIINKFFNNNPKVYNIIALVLIYYFYKFIRHMKNPYISLLGLYVLYLSFWPLTLLMNLLLQCFVKNKNFVKNYKEFDILEEKYNDHVKHELDNIYEKYKPKHCIKDVNPGFSIGFSDKKCWRSINIKSLGKFVLPMDDYPVLKSVLQNKIVSNAFLSILDPHVNIPEHTGYYRGYLRYHLGYKIPKGAFISVDGQKYEWTEGKGVMFDDMYPHYVENDTNYTRIVLYIDILRKLPAPLHYINTLYIYLISNHFVLKKITKRDHSVKKLIN